MMNIERLEFHLKKILKFYSVKMLLYIFMRHVEHRVRLGLGSHLKKILKFYSVMFKNVTLHFQWDMLNIEWGWGRGLIYLTFILSNVKHSEVGVRVPFKNKIINVLSHDEHRVRLGLGSYFKPNSKAYRLVFNTAEIAEHYIFLWNKRSFNWR